MITGVHRVPGSARSIAQALVDSEPDAPVGRTAVVAPSTRISVFYDELARALDWPGYFGRNLDALWDFLTDLDRPTVLILADWTRLARARPVGWAAILDVLDDRARLDPPFAVLLTD